MASEDGRGNEVCDSDEGVAINYLKSLDNLMREYSDLQTEDTSVISATNNFNLNFNILDYQKMKGFTVNNRMETILEEPLTTKLTVKEILAKFETLKEADTVIYDILFECKPHILSIHMLLIALVIYNF